jgi:hypothetical protein
MEKLELGIGDVVRLDIDDKALFLNVRCVSGWNGEMSYLELQATDPDGKVHIIELSKQKDLPKNWKSSGWQRLRLGRKG